MDYEISHDEWDANTDVTGCHKMLWKNSKFKLKISGWFNNILNIINHSKSAEKEIALDVVVWCNWRKLKIFLTKMNSAKISKFYRMRNSENSPCFSLARNQKNANTDSSESWMNTPLSLSTCLFVVLSILGESPKEMLFWQQLERDSTKLRRIIPS